MRLRGAVRSIVAGLALALACLPAAAAMGPDPIALIPGDPGTSVDGGAVPTVPAGTPGDPPPPADHPLPPPPATGGIEVRNVSRAVTALQNANASALFQALQPGVATTSTALSNALRMHSGTARWHLKKLKEFGLVEEVPGPEGARYLPTPLGQ